MTNCTRLEAPVFLAAQKIKSFEETPEGFMLECFLINTKINANDWMVTADANIQDGKTFEGRPDIEFINPEGKRDHTVGKSFEESIAVQEPFRKGTIQKVLGTETGEKLTSISLITDSDVIRKIKSHELQFVSPAVFPRSLEDIEIIRTGPNTHVHILHRYRGLHRAFVDEPAYETIDATLGPTCEGPIEECMIKLEQVQAGIGDSEIDPLRERKIISVKKCTVTGNTIIEFENTSNSKEKSTSNKLPTDEEMKKLDSRISKIADEIEEKLKGKADIETEEEKTSRLANEEETRKKEEAKKSKSKKGNEQEDKTAEELEKEKEAKKAEEEKKEEDMTARIAGEISEKLPLIEKFVAAKTQVAGLDSKAVTALREKLMKASLDTLKEKWDDIKEFAAGLPVKEIETESPIGYGASESFTASKKFEEMSGSELEEAAGMN